MTRLEQLRLQIVGPTAIAEPEIARALNLNQTQAQQVQEITARFHQQTADLTMRYFQERNDSNAGFSTGLVEQAAGDSSANTPTPAGRIVGDRRTFSNPGSSRAAESAVIGTSSYGTVSGGSNPAGSRVPIPADNGTLSAATVPFSDNAATPVGDGASAASPRSGGDVPVTSGGARNGAGPADVASQKVRETGSEAEGLDSLRRAVPARQSRGISERLYARHLTEFRETAERDIREVLSPTQWRQYSDLLGPPFNFAALFQSTPIPAAADTAP